MDEEIQTKGLNTVVGDSSAKAFGGIVAIVALVAGVASIIRPMQVEIDRISIESSERSNRIEQQHIREVGDLRSQIDRLIEIQSANVTNIAVVEQRNAEVISELERRINRLESAFPIRSYSVPPPDDDGK